jgi:hypothetical protein
MRESCSCFHWLIKCFMTRQKDKITQSKATQSLQSAWKSVSFPGSKIVIPLDN